LIAPLHSTDDRVEDFLHVVHSNAFGYRAGQLGGPVDHVVARGGSISEPRRWDSTKTADQGDPGGAPGQATYQEGEGAGGGRSSHWASSTASRRGRAEATARTTANVARLRERLSTVSAVSSGHMIVRSTRA
jgi:hypothetical protein